MARYWRCPGCGRTRTEMGFWLHQSEVCRCGWPIQDYTQVRPDEAEAIAEQQRGRAKGGY